MNLSPQPSAEFLQARDEFFHEIASLTPTERVAKIQVDMISSTLLKIAAENHCRALTEEVQDILARIGQDITYSDALAELMEMIDDSDPRKDDEGDELMQA